MAPPDDFPMTAKQFLAEAETHLRTGDIILSRSPTLMSWLIRFATGSHFSHAAFVFLVQKPEEGFMSTFLLESVRSGVGLAKLRDWIGGRRPRAEIAVLRLEGNEFNEIYFKKVRGLMLDHVNSGYDFGRVLRLALSAAFGLRLGWSKVMRGSPASMRHAVSRTRRRFRFSWVPPEFICSGFIQYGLVKAAEMRGIKSSVMLKEGLSSDDLNGILAVTPEDVARSPRLKWLYMARRGWVHTAENYTEAIALMSGGKR